MAGLPKEDAGHPVGTTVLVREEIAVAERSGSTHTRRWPAIRFVSLVAGLVSLTAVALGARPTRVSAQSPDPTRLPIATIAQLPLTGAYNALNVPSKVAGHWYLDPTTGVRVYRLTSGSFPASRAGWAHDYAEGGSEVSLPHTGSTRTVLVYDWRGTHWLLDFTPGVGVSKPRQLTHTLRPYADISFTFSTNPATPYYAYVGNGADILRFDVRTMTEVPGDGWPVSAANVQWLTQSENDGLFAWLQSDTAQMTVYEPSTRTTKAAAFTTGHQVQVDKGGRYILWSNSGNSGSIWDFTTGTTVWTTPGFPDVPFAHTGMLRRRVGVTDWNAHAPFNFAYLKVDVPGSQMDVGGPAASNFAHTNGGWIQNPADLNDQWALTAHYGPYELTSGYLAPSGLILWTINGGRRLLAHHYNTSSAYIWSPFAKLSADGAYVLFTSDMNGSGRSDVFLAEMPGVPSGPKADLGVYRPSTATWYILRPGDGTQQAVQWGLDGDTLVPGDYDGDGKTDVAVYRPSIATWYILRSSDGALQQLQWGATDDIPVPHDYDGDGQTDVAVYRPSTGTWYILRSSDGTLQQVQWGAVGDQPLPRDYDGDGKADLAVYRPSTGTWYILRSSDGTPQQVQWGAAGDQPLP